MEVGVPDALDFSTLKAALNVESYSHELISNTVSLMNNGAGSIMKSVTTQIPELDASVTGAGGFFSVVA